MSVLDQFRNAEQRVAERLRELEPLVEEYRELQRVAERLGLNVDEARTATGNRPPASQGSSRRRRRDSTRKAGSAASNNSAVTKPARGARAARRSADGAPPGSNRSSRRRDDILRLVNERPGITVRQIAKELGVDSTGLYRPVHKLEEDGAISKRGAALRPAGR